MSIANKMELLWNSANSLSSDSHTHRLLKSYYINTCLKLARNNLQVPREKFSNSQMCPYCGSFWSDSDFGLKLRPKQLNITLKSKKLIESLDKAEGSTFKILTKSQRNRAKWLKKKTFNHLEVRCNQCKRKSLIAMENPKYKSRNHAFNKKTMAEKETPVLDASNEVKNVIKSSYPTQNKWRCRRRLTENQVKHEILSMSLIYELQRLFYTDE